MISLVVLSVRCSFWCLFAWSASKLLPHQLTPRLSASRHPGPYKPVARLGPTGDHVQRRNRLSIHGDPVNRVFGYCFLIRHMEASWFGGNRESSV